MLDTGEGMDLILKRERDIDLSLKRGMCMDLILKRGRDIDSSLKRGRGALI